MKKMKKTKKEIRRDFRQSVFDRSGGLCEMCKDLAADAHHITDRNLMPNGGYVSENGIAVCAKCHVRAEAYHISGGKICEPGWWPNDLYAAIGSSYEKAYEASLQLSTS